MSEREAFEKNAGDPRSDSIWWDEHRERYHPADKYDPDVANAADCWNWGLSSWQARADLAAERERELVDAATNVVDCLSSQVPTYLDELAAALAKYKEQCE